MHHNQIKGDGDSLCDSNKLSTNLKRGWNCYQQLERRKKCIQSPIFFFSRELKIHFRFDRTFPFSFPCMNIWNDNKIK
jgi:hypothetical protein